VINLAQNYTTHNNTMVKIGMENMLRIDSFDLNMAAYKSLTGRYFVPVVIGKVGLGLKYSSVNQDGQFSTRVEKVSEEGLFNRDYIDSCKGSPVCLYHPPSGKYNGNQDGLLVGHLDSRFKRDVADDTLVFMASVDDARAVKLMDQTIEAGKAPQGSPCYTVKRLIQRQDHQEQIRSINDHYAFPLCRGEGRGGDDIGMRFDSNVVQVSEPVLETKLWLFSRPDIYKSTKTMDDQINSDAVSLAVEHTNGITYSIPVGGLRKDQQNALVGLRDRHDTYYTENGKLRADNNALTEQVQTLEAELATVRSDLDGVEEQAQELEDENKALKEQAASTPNIDSAQITAQINQEVADRLAILSELEPLLNKRNIKLDSNTKKLYERTSPELLSIYLNEIYNPPREDADRVKDEEFRADSTDSDQVVYDSAKAMTLWRRVKPSTLNAGRQPAATSNTNSDQARQDAIDKTDQQFNMFAGETKTSTDPRDEMMNIDASDDIQWERARLATIKDGTANGHFVSKV